MLKPMYKMKGFAKILTSAVLLLLAMQAMAEDQSQPSVEDNIRAMDKDHDGIVTVYEVRAFIEAKHGKDYEKDALDLMESSAKGKSCKTPFANVIY